MMNKEQKDIHDVALKISQDYRTTETSLIDILQKADEKRVYAALGYSSLFVYAVESLKLSEANAQALTGIARKAKTIPKLKEEIEKGVISVSKAQRIVSVITKENQSEWLAKASTLSKRELEKEVVKVNPEKVREMVRPVAEDRLRLQLGISEAVIKKLRRAQALLSSKQRKPASFEEVFEASLDRFLEKEDPIQKADRAEKRKLPCPGKVAGGVAQIGKRIPVPAFIKHQVFKRDQGKCQIPNCDSSYFVELHHKIPVSRGGLNTVDNLTTLCSTHHHYHHQNCLAVQSQRTGKWRQNP